MHTGGVAAASSTIPCAIASPTSARSVALALVRDAIAHEFDIFLSLIVRSRYATFVAYLSLNTVAHNGGKSTQTKRGRPGEGVRHRRTPQRVLRRLDNLHHNVGAVNGVGGAFSAHDRFVGGRRATMSTSTSVALFGGLSPDARFYGDERADLALQRHHRHYLHDVPPPVARVRFYSPTEGALDADGDAATACTDDYGYEEYDYGGNGAYARPFADDDMYGDGGYRDDDYANADFELARERARAHAHAYTRGAYHVPPRDHSDLAAQQWQGLNAPVDDYILQTAAASAHMRRNLDGGSDYHWQSASARGGPSIHLGIGLPRGVSASRIRSQAVHAHGARSRRRRHSDFNSFSSEAW
jgi:hypothetical protein